MAANFALISVFGGALTGVALWPAAGWLSLVAAPFGGSAAALVLGVVQAARARSAALSSQAQTNEMVASLRSVLKAAERPSTPARPAVEAERRRAAG